VYAEIVVSATDIFGPPFSPWRAPCHVRRALWHAAPPQDKAAPF
jgi:hypothetical protein